MRNALANVMAVLVGLLFANHALASEIKPPALTGKLVESISIISDFSLTPGEWKNCELVPNQTFELHRCIVEGSSLVVEKGSQDIVMTFTTASKIGSNERMRFDEYVLRGTLPNGLSVIVDIIHNLDDDTWRGSVNVDQLIEHKLIINNP